MKKLTILNTYRIYALTIDEMEIKKHVDTDQSGKVQGFQDIGCGPMDSDDQLQATKSLVVLAIGINAHWKLPLGYSLTNGASTDLQVTLLTDVLTELWDCGCTAVSETFDGLMANQKTLRKLEGSLDPDNLISCFQHPCNPAVSVVMIFDACHMMKIARNLLNEYQILTIGGTAKAKWKHLELLHDIQQQEGLTLANKLAERREVFRSEDESEAGCAPGVILVHCSPRISIIYISDIQSAAYRIHKPRRNTAQRYQ